MQTFELVREVDVSGVSGTGVVAEGIVFSNGKAVLGWNSEVHSVCVYDNIQALEQIHGHGGCTKIRYKENQ
jgi:hypothetical protein